MEIDSLGKGADGTCLAPKTATLRSKRVSSRRRRGKRGKNAKDQIRERPEGRGQLLAPPEIYESDEPSRVRSHSPIDVSRLVTRDKEKEKNSVNNSNISLVDQNTDLEGLRNGLHSEEEKELMEDDKVECEVRALAFKEGLENIEMSSEYADRARHKDGETYRARNVQINAESDSDDNLEKLNSQGSILLERRVQRKSAHVSNHNVNSIDNPEVNKDPLESEASNTVDNESETKSEHEVSISDLKLSLSSPWDECERQSEDVSREPSEKDKTSVLYEDPEVEEGIFNVSRSTKTSDVFRFDPHSHNQEEYDAHVMMKEGGSKNEGISGGHAASNNVWEESSTTEQSAVETSSQVSASVSTCGTSFRGPREIEGSVGTASGLMHQLASRVPTTIKSTSFISEFQQNIDSYVPEFVKDYTSIITDSIGEASKKDKIMWVKFQRIENMLCLLIGYENGFHVWDASDRNKLKELVSVKDGIPVRMVEYLETPENELREDVSGCVMYEKARPLLAVCKYETSQEGERLESALEKQSVRVGIFSLGTHTYVREITFGSKVLSIKSNKQVVVVALESSVEVLSSSSFERRFSYPCFPSPTENAALALGSRWLAFASPEAVTVGVPYDKQVDESFKDDGDVDVELAWQSMTNAAKGFASGLSYLGDLGAQYVQGNSKQHMRNVSSMPSIATNLETESLSPSEQDSSIEVKDNTESSRAVGCVSVVDLNTNNMISNFRSHKVAIELMGFSNSGSLLVVAPVGGHRLHVHKILPRNILPGRKEMQPSHMLLYSLERGMTAASIRHVAFSDDLRWLAMTSSRGTSHIYAINPDGGPVSAYSHCVVIGNQKKPDSRANKVTTGRNSSIANDHRNVEKVPRLKNAVASLGKSLSGTISGRNDEIEKLALNFSKEAGLSDRAPVIRSPEKNYLTYPEGHSSHRSRKLYAVARVRQPVYSNVSEILSREDKCSRLAGNDVDDSASFASTPSKNSDLSQRSLGRFSSSEHGDMLAPVCSCFLPDSGQLLVVSSAGMLEKYDIIPLAAEKDNRKLSVRTVPICRWDVCRRQSWLELRASAFDLDDRTVDKLNVSTSRERLKTDRANWLSNVEIQSHARPLLSVWASPQINFAVFTSDNNQEMRVPSSVESVEATTIAVRGEGPLPQEYRDEYELKFAIDTPTSFQNLEEPSEHEVNETVLIYDDPDGQEKDVERLDEPMFEDDYVDETDYEAIKQIDRKVNKDKNE